MKIPNIKKESEDLIKIRKFLEGLGFICNSDPSAQNLIYSKNNDIIILKR